MAGTSYKLDGGKKLQAALKQLSAKAKNAATLSVGFPEGRTEPDGAATAVVAYFNEFGTASAPPRPFFRNAIAQHSPDWGRNLGKLLVAAHYDAGTALRGMGEEIVGQVQESIQTFASPPLAPSTVKQKGFAKPLIDSSTMFKGVSAWTDGT